MAENNNTTTIWRIAKWDKVFEKAETRRHKVLTWISMPVGFTSSGYQSLLDEFGEEAPAIYGAWCALCAFAAQCPTRGTLGNTQQRPITWPTVARVTGFPVTVFQRLAEWATRPEVAWLTSTQPLENTEKTGTNPHAQHSPSDGPAFAQHSAGLPNPTQPNPTRPNQTDTQPNQAVGLSVGLDFGNWQKVADRLAAMNVTRWREATMAARDCGCTPEHAIELIDYAETNGFAIGQLVHRLGRAHPSLAANVGWPDRHEKTKAATAKRSATDTAKAKEAEATAIVRAGRSVKKSDEEILEILKSKGLEWPK